jgi:hypothetical protein
VISRIGVLGLGQWHPFGHGDGVVTVVECRLALVKTGPSRYGGEDRQNSYNDCASQNVIHGW